MVRILIISLWTGISIICLPAGVSAQQARQEKGLMLFRGVVSDSETGHRMAGSQIEVNGLLRAVSRNDGTFSFFAKENDTIRVTQLGYKPYIYLVSDTLRAQEFLTGIYLAADTIGIGEVLIIPRLPSLTGIALSPRAEDVLRDNARNNVATASYQGRTGRNRLGDPAMNYELLRQKQKVETYERGGIPSERIAGLSPFILIPAAYLLINGLPELPEPPGPRISGKEIEELDRLYKESVRKRTGIGNLP